MSREQWAGSGEQRTELEVEIIVWELPSRPADFFGEGCGEYESLTDPLPGHLGVGDAAADVGHKAHVRLVQHGDGDVAALGEVEEPDGGGHQHVTALGGSKE